MRVLLVVVLVACGGSKAPAPVSNAAPVSATPAPPPEPPSRCGCTSEVCRGDNEMTYALAKMCTYAEHMCACKDKACGDGVNDDFTRWMNDMAKSASGKRPAISDADAKAMADHAIHYQECYAKLVGGSTTP
jgi:hypothetical protein